MADSVALGQDAQDMNAANCARTALLAVFLACATVSTATAQNLPRADPITPSASFDLTAADRRALEQSAEEGDADAALRLAAYYDIARRNRAEGMRWTRRAAELGSLRGRHNLAVELLASREPEERQEAIRLLITNTHAGFLSSRHELYVTGKSGLRSPDPTERQESMQLLKKAAAAGELEAAELLECMPRCLQWQQDAR